MTEPDAFRLGVTLASALDEAGVPNALGGALALAAWGVPRATVDVDINVFVEDAALDRVLDVLARTLGAPIDRAAAKRDHAANGMFVVTSSAGIRIDVFTPSRTSPIWNGSSPRSAARWTLPMSAVGSPT
jgi:hypothetical protein